MAMAGYFLAAALTGCSPSEPAPPTATLGTAPPVTPTTDPYAVPAVIDAAYVNRVLEVFDAAVGDVVRMVMREGQIPQEVLDRLKAMYLNEAHIQLRLDVLQFHLDDGFRGFKVDPGNQSSTVTELLSARSDCLFVKVSRDYAAVGSASGANVGTEWVGLRPAIPGRDLYRYNPTPWGVVVDGVRDDRSQPENPCAGR